MTSTGQAIRVGVLALQGDFDAHAKALRRAGGETVDVCEVRKPEHLAGLEALVLPGGESTTIAKSLDRFGLCGPLVDFAKQGHPVLGTCAGAILLAARVENHPVETLHLLDVTAVRNAYGTQVDSFATPVDAGAAHGLDGLVCVFIRAPRFRDLGPGVSVMARVDGEPVFVRQGNVMAATFHPELTEDDRVHRMLLDAVRR